MIEAQIRPRPSEGSSQRRRSGDIPKTFTPDYEMKRALTVDAKSPEARERFLSYELMQMETHLGERFNVNISRFEYEIRDGKLYGKDMDEPFIESIKRGRDIRKKEGKEIDFTREDAEVEGFTKIEKVLSDPDSPVGTMMLSISPKGQEGSTYQHNFYDIFTIKEKDGKRYIETRRYASALDIEAYKNKISAFTDVKIDSEDSAASFLANPIAIENSLTADDLHAYFHNDHKFMDEKTFEVIKDHCRELAREYSKSLLDEPKNINKHRLLFNAYLNKADEVLGSLSRGEFLESSEKIRNNEGINLVYADMMRYGNEPVREVMTGCGASGGYDKKTQSSESPFSVVEFAKDNYGERTFNCPECKKENVRPYNTLLAKCQHCSSTKVAC